MIFLKFIIESNLIMIGSICAGIYLNEKLAYSIENSKHNDKEIIL